MSKTLKKTPNWLAFVSGFLGLALAIGLCSFSIGKAFSGSSQFVFEGDMNVESLTLQGQEPQLGGASGAEHLVAERFAAGFQRNILSTSTSGSAATILESELEGYDILEMMVYTQNFTWTLPATSTISSILPEPGDSRTWIIRSMTTTTGAAKPTLTIAAGIGWELLGIDANVDIILPNETAVLDCFRTGATSTNAKSRDIICGIQELIDAD